jgi:LmbE family N-acetylglucosaminyl deacetylase
MSSLRVLAICAHPDDYEYSASATLSKLAVNGNTIRGLVLTHGEKGGNGAKRVIEAEESASRLGFKHAKVLGFPDTRLPEHIPEISVAIKRATKEFDPHLIFTHSAHDRHQDHVAVYQATTQAVSHCLILCFESPSSRDFKADCGVHIGELLKDKLDCIAIHADQRNKPYMQPDHIIKWSEECGDMERFELVNCL